MMSMIERVAAAIADPGKYCGFRGELSMSEWQARAAVTAMREPTPQMIAEAWAGITTAKNVNRIGRLGPGPGATDVWRAMIDASLAARVVTPEGDPA